MDTGRHDLNSLLSQLGLASDAAGLMPSWPRIDWKVA